MPHAKHNETHQDYGPIVTKYVVKNLEHGLSEPHAVDSVVEVLNREQETADDEEAKQG